MSFKDTALRLTRMLAREGMRALLAPERRSSPRTHTQQRHRPSAGSDTAQRARSTTSGPTRTQGAHGPYRGDWTQPLPATSYAPTPDGRPDPGEVVWAWVPFEEDHTQGKDRPTLVVARHPELADVVLALPLTSKDHDRDAAQEARAGRHWMDVGSGAWDNRGRPSEVRLDRVLQLDATAVRREGASLDRATFDAVVAAVRQSDQ